MLGKIWGYTMKDWENNFAASFMYQDLADCSIGAVPLANELIQAKNTHKDNELKKKMKEIKTKDILRKVSAYLFILISMVTKVM